MKDKVLIVDDEKDIVELLEYNLGKEGYRVLSAFDGEKALDLAKKEKPAVIILDLMLPGLDGLEVCKILKSDPQTAGIFIIMLTAKAGETDKVVGLELGADDYVAKPFSVREMLARVKAVLRRVKDNTGLPGIFKIGDLSVDFSKVLVTVKDKPVSLTSKEFELLKVLIGAKGRVLSRDYLLDNIWGFDNAMDIQTRTVDVHIRTLRKKIKNEAKRIVTVKNYGYRFEVED
jgi:two-component system alkaline phosphatase synthesis response regulator PhoP